MYRSESKRHDLLIEVEHVKAHRTEKERQRSSKRKSLKAPI